MTARITATAFALLAAAVPSQERSRPRPPVKLTFGVYTSEKASEMHKAFAPVKEDLESRTAAHFGRPVTIELQIHKTYEECFDAFLRGEVDFVRFGPAAYVLAKERNPKIELLAAEEDDGKKVSQGVIFVRKDSPVRTLSDLAGRTFAFGDDMSTIGRYLAQSQLVKAGIHAKDLQSFRYLGRHDKVLMAVQVGDFDAGSVHIATFEKMNQDQQLRVLKRFDNISKAWVARAGLAPTLCDALRKGVLDLKRPASLAVLKVTGFQTATDSDYADVRTGIEDAKRFEQAAPEPPDKR